MLEKIMYEEYQELNKAVYNEILDTYDNGYSKAFKFIYTIPKDSNKLFDDINILIKKILKINSKLTFFALSISELDNDNYYIKINPKFIDEDNLNEFIVEINDDVVGAYSQYRESLYNHIDSRDYWNTHPDLFYENDDHIVRQDVLCEFESLKYIYENLIREENYILENLESIPNITKLRSKIFE